MNILHNYYPNLTLPFASEIWTNLGKKKQLVKPHAIFLTF